MKIKLKNLLMEGKQYWYRLSGPKSDKYADQTKARCFTLSGQDYINVEFGDEYNGFVVPNKRAGKRNNQIALEKYFTNVELYKVG